MLDKTTIGEVTGMIRLSNRRRSGTTPKPVKGVASGPLSAEWEGIERTESSKVYDSVLYVISHKASFRHNLSSVILEAYHARLGLMQEHKTRLAGRTHSVCM
jgi:hypothetical protein